MSQAARDRAAAIFLSLSQVDADRRAALIAERCGDDAALRTEVERLLAALEVVDTPVDTPPHGAATGPADGASLGAGAVIGDFVVVRQIGAGGTGVVHLAHQQHPPRVVALKVLRREFFASAVQRRFEIEAELLATLHHPGIAQVYAAHPGNGTTPPFIAMELVNGPVLTEFADSRQLSVRERIDLVAHVSDAVQHAHQRGIIHRDLKPGNILVNAEGQPKVLDFGVARRLEHASPATIATELGQLVGTLAYMSPEQVQANPDAIDTRTDIHALGVILFRLLAGRLPFGHDNPSLPELARRIAQDEAPKLGTIDPALRGDLEVIVSRALAKEKERRYPSAAAFATDLRRYLEGQPISASADSAWYLVRRQLGRYRLAFGLSAAMLVAVSALAFYALLQRGRANDMNRRLESELSTSTIERARLISMTGNHPAAEELAWRELFRHPESTHATWALRQIYSKDPSLWTRVVHEKGTHAVRFSPDSTMLLTTGRVDGLLHLIDVRSGRIIRTFETNPRSGSRRSHFTADGKSIVSGSEDGTLRVWDVATGRLQREVPKAMPVLFDFAISPDGATAVTVALTRAEVWSLTAGVRTADLSGLIKPASAAGMNPMAPQAGIGSDHGMLIGVDLTTSRKLWEVRAHSSLVTSVVYSADGKHIATGSFDGWARLWDSQTGELLRALSTEAGRVRTVAFDESGTRLAVGGQWKSLVWDLTQPTESTRDIGGSDGTTDVHLSADGRYMATCHGANGQVRLWDLPADPRLGFWRQPGSVRALEIGPDGRTIYTAGDNAVISTVREGEIPVRPVIQPHGTIYGFDISRDGRWLAAVGVTGTSGVWDLTTGQRVAELSTVGNARSVVFADDDRLVLTGERDGTLRTWEWANGAAKEIRQRRSTEGEVLALAAQGTRVIVGHTEHAVLALDARSGQEIGRTKSSAAPFSLAITPDAQLVAIGTYLGAVEIWDIPNDRQRPAAKGPTALINGVDFSPDGTLLAIASRDGSTRIWDVVNGRFLAIVAVRDVVTERVRFLQNGTHIAIGHSNGSVELVDLNHFLRHVAGNAEFQLGLLRAAGESLPRAGEVIEWSRKVLAER